MRKEQGKKETPFISFWLCFLPVTSISHLHHQHKYQSLPDTSALWWSLTKKSRDLEAT